MGTEPEILAVAETNKTPGTNGRGRVRLRAARAALGAALLDALPGGLELAQWMGVDPVTHAKRGMLREMGKDADRVTTESSLNTKAAPLAAKQAARGIVRVGKVVLKGTRYTGLLAKRGALIVTVVSSVASGVGAYRELTTLGFAALDEE